MCDTTQFCEATLMAASNQVDVDRALASTGRAVYGMHLQAVRAQMLNVSSHTVSLLARSDRYGM